MPHIGQSIEDIKVNKIDIAFAIMEISREDRQVLGVGVW